MQRILTAQRVITLRQPLIGARAGEAVSPADASRSRPVVRMALLTSAVSWLLSACTIAPSDSFAQGCTSRTDCASDETCDRGECVAVSRTNRTDGGISRTGQGFSIDDAGNIIRDTVLVDAGTVPDTGVTQPPVDDCTAERRVGVGAQKYCTLAEAIEQAPAGSTLQIPSGIWREDLTLSRPIRLVGVGATTILNREAAVAIVVKSDDVFLENLIIDGNRKEGISVEGSLTTNAVTVTAAMGAGIRVLQGRLTFENSRIIGVDCAGGCTGQDWGEGIVFSENTTGMINSSNVEGSSFIGVYINGATVEFRNADITGNGRELCTANVPLCFSAIYARNGARVTMSSSSKARLSGGPGIEIDGAQLTMLDSVSQSNLGPGVLVRFSNITLQNNRIEQNGAQGVVCEDATVNSCASNYHINNTGGWVNEGQCNGSCL